MKTRSDLPDHDTRTQSRSLGSFVAVHVAALVVLLLFLPKLGFAQLADTEVENAKKIGATTKRSYFFKEADKEMSYSLFVSSKYEKATKAPLLMLLHGLRSNPGQVIRYKGIREEAEKRGYIVVAPYGYNSRGWYGSRGKGKTGRYFGKEDDPDNLGELSEKDVMNVLKIVQKDFNIDKQRIYLAGHSMGGGGAIYLGAKYPDIWAALAPMSPAAYFDMSILEKLKHIPLIIVTGDKDRLIPVTEVRRWIKRMKELKIKVVYTEIKDGNHVTSIARNPEMIASVFDFFDEHSRQSDDEKKAE